MLTEPIVEGAYYLCENGDVHRAGGYARGWDYLHDGQATWWGTIQSHIKLVRKVHLVPTDPAEVVAELRRKHQEAQRSLTGFPISEYFTGLRDGHEISSDLVSKKLGVK